MPRLRMIAGGVVVPSWNEVGDAWNWEECLGRGWCLGTGRSTLNRARARTFNVHHFHSALISLIRLTGNPFAAQPAVEHIQAGLGLMHRHHMSGGVNADKGEIGRALDLARLGVLAPKRCLQR